MLSSVTVNCCGSVSLWQGHIVAVFYHGRGTLWQWLIVAGAHCGSEETREVDLATQDAVRLGKNVSKKSSSSHSQVWCYLEVPGFLDKDKDTLPGV